ncbi:Fe-S cluster assembly protein SufD [Agromyces sp. SYSU T00194]|uniref:Fe-S cluster assembly protein SufD n=1 Tax=Agromyces chitinivorans TaxID=3158560 RepID=UPI00339707B7
MTSAIQTPPVAPGSRAHSDGAGAFVPVQTRTERTRSYDPADFGMPAGTEVDWKHTPVARIAGVLADVATDDRPGDPAVAWQLSGADAVTVGTLAVGQAPRGEAFTPEDLPSALAWTHTDEALHVVVPQDVELDAPVVISLTGNGAERRANGHVVLEAKPNSRGTIVLRHSGSTTFAQNVEVLVREGANLTVVSVQEWADDAIHAAAHQARVERDAYLRHVVVSFGGGVVRLNPSVELAGEGSEAELYGLSFSDAGQHFESQVFLHHKGPHTRGDVLYKGALQGETARSVWIGDVLIGRDAVGTDSYEANRNLVLTPGARADSIPNLEIETGDIQGAGHASATGRFDDEQLFYLQARGIREDEARRLVVIGFLAEIVQKIRVPELEEHLAAAIEAELAGGVLPS